jgi:argininosuccinate synthase
VITLDFARGDPVAIDGVYLSPAALLTKLNQLGHDNGIGRLDLGGEPVRRDEEPRRL